MLPTEIDSSVKVMLWEGKKAVDVAKLLGIPVNTVYNIKAGRRGYYVLWPNGQEGSMPMQREAVISRKQNGRGRHKELQSTYQLVEQAEQFGQEQGMGPATQGTTGAPNVVVRDDVEEIVDPRFDSYEQMMSVALDEYRSKWAFANGYHQEILPVLSMRAKYMSGEIKLSLDEVKKLSDQLCRCVARLLGGCPKCEE